MVVDLEYKYKATVVKIKDADTIVVNWDMGRRIVLEKQELRLDGIDTNELGTIDGENAAEWLRRKMPVGTEFVLQTIKISRGQNKGQDKQEKYGRYLAIIWLDGVNINQQMLELGLAKSYNGKGPKPWQDGI